MNEENNENFTWRLVSALLPMLGWVLYYKNRNTRPVIANSAAKGAKLGVGLYIIGAVAAGVMLIDESTSVPDIQYTTSSGDTSESGDYSSSSDDSNDSDHASDYADAYSTESEIDIYESESEILENELESGLLDEDTDTETSTSAESNVESSDSDNSSNTITGQGTASQIVLRATSKGKTTIKFVLGSTIIEEEFTDSYERVLTTAEVATANNQNNITTFIRSEGDAESLTCSIEIDGVVASSNAVYPDDPYKFTICQVLPID